MNVRKQIVKGLGLNYSIAVDKETYDYILSVKQGLYCYGGEVLGIGEVACLLVAVGAAFHLEKIENQRLKSTCFADKPKMKHLMSDSSRLLKQLQEIINQEQGRICEHN